MLNNNLVKFIGNIRIYTLIDLFLLLYIIGARGFSFIGGVSLWLFFLFYLEWKHRHSYRAKAPLVLWLFFLFVGLIFYPIFGGIFFVLLVILYTEKHKGLWGVFAPIFRGLQATVLCLPFFGFFATFPWIAGGIIFIRNLLGDFRDGEKDAKEGLKTIPVVLGIEKNIPYIHLIGVMMTTLIWWTYSGLPFYLVIGIWLVQISTYNLTPR